MIELINVSKYYSTNDRATLGLKNINVKFDIGEIVAITGKSGCGKSTLLNVICGMDTYELGRMIIDDKDTSSFSIEDFEDYRRNNVAFIFQNYQLIDSYTVYQNVMMALIISNYKGDIKKRCLELIEEVGLSHRINNKATKLSGGEKQRVAIARALASDAKILACDEPTGNLDSKTSNEIISLIKKVSKDKLVLIVTHDYEEVKDIVTRKIRLFDGSIVEDTKINPLEEIKDNQPLNKGQLTFKQVLKLALTNIFSTPKKLILITITLFIFLMAIDFIIGNISNPIQYYYNHSMANFQFSENRLLVSKKDDLVDIQELKFGNNTVIKNDFVYDQYIRFSYSNYQYMANFSVPNVNKKVVYGDLPQKHYDVVLEVPQNMINNFKDATGKTINISGNEKEYTISGIAIADSFKIMPYYADDLYEIFYREILLYDDAFYNVIVSNKQLSIQYNYFDEKDKFMVPNIFQDENIYIEYGGKKILIQKEDIEYYEVETDDDFYFMEIPKKNVDLLKKYFLDNIFQASVIYEDGTYDETVNTLKSLGYRVVDVEKILISRGNIYNYFILFIAFLFMLMIVYFVTAVILTFIMRTKQKDYAILRTFGLSNKDSRKILTVEFLVVEAITIILFIIYFIIFHSNKVSLFIDITAGRFFFDFIIYSSLILLLVSKFNKKIFVNTINKGLKKGE